MILANRNQFIETSFVFVSEGQIYDPTNLATPIDIIFSIVRGDYGVGPVVDGPFSFLRDNSDLEDRLSITRTGNGQFVFRYKVPDTFHEGIYTVLAQTRDSLNVLAIGAKFQVKGAAINLSPVVISSAAAASVTYKPLYEDLNRRNTNTVLLIGHADGIPLNNPIKVRSMQDGIDALNAESSSPLLRGLFDAYASGARDVFIMAAAPMSEYVENYLNRLTSNALYDLNSVSPVNYTFYEKYYERLEETYSIIKDLDYIDYIVPLETSFIRTGDVDFVTQLANYLSDFHNETGFVQLGIIGSRSGGVSSSDVDLMKSNNILVNKFTEFSIDNEIVSDKGRYIIPVYGEIVMRHDQLKLPYTSNLAASVAGMLASMPLNLSMIRTRIPGAASLFGADLTQKDIQDLENIGINTVYRGKRTRRLVPFEVYMTNEYTMANRKSSFFKAAQMRLVATVVSEIKDLASAHIGKLGYEKVIEEVKSMLDRMRYSNIIVDYALNFEIDRLERGKIIFYIQLRSSLGLKKIDFAISAGPEA